MYGKFLEGHQEIVKETIEQTKGTIVMREQDVQTILVRTIERMQPAQETMHEQYEAYKEFVRSHLGKIVRLEIKRLVDQRIDGLGLGGGLEMEQLIAPMNNMERLSQILERVNKNELRIDRLEQAATKEVNQMMSELNRQLEEAKEN